MVQEIFYFLLQVNAIQTMQKIIVEEALMEDALV
jgi:hypothetical protein